MSAEKGSAIGELRPLRLEALFVPRIWGARTLEPLYSGAQVTDKSPIGEVWLTGNDCKFVDAPFEGRKIAEAWREMSAAWTGTHANTAAPFPLLAKFLFPRDKLSVQVHPNDEYARAHESAAGGTGKTEMWYAVEAREGAEVFVGLRAGVTAEIFRGKIADGSVEDCLNTIPIRAGDAIFVPAGTAHTIGPGSILCEIQENSDLTYRVFDYNRRNPDGSARELHVAKAMAVLNFGEQRGGKLEAARAAAHGGEIAHLVACKYFAVERWEFADAITLRTEPEHFELWIVISGGGNISWGAETDAPARTRHFFEYAPGAAIFIPAGLAGWSIEPSASTKMIRAYVPDLDVYAKQLAASGIPIEAAARVIYR